MASATGAVIGGVTGGAGAAIGAALGGGGKHSGSGSNRNYDIGNANEVFKNIVGRDLRQDEINWLNSRGDVGKTGHDVAAAAYAQGLQQLSQNIQAQASAYGIQNFDKAQADQIRDSLYQAGNQYIADNFNDLVSAKLSQTKIDQLQNPQISTQQADQNNATAARIIQEQLGRQGTADEVQFYSDLLKKGESPFELAQFVQTTPEYQKIQSDKQSQQYKQESEAARQALEQQGQQSDEEAFRRALPEIIGNFQASGRLNSSGLNSAIAKARADIQAQRQQYMSQIGYEDAVRQQGYNREDFLNRNAQGYDQYLRQSAPQYQAQAGLTQLAYQRPFQLADDRTTRAREIEDYYRQQSDFNRYFDQQRKAQREASLYGLGGNLLSAGLQAGIYRR